jgi:hypothetical protein
MLCVESRFEMNDLRINSGMDGRRAPRASMHVIASLREPGTSKFDVKLLDLSSTGFRFETAYNFHLEARVWLTIPGMAGLEAIIKWRNSFIYGAAFVQPLYPAVMDHVAKRFGDGFVGR